MLIRMIALCRLTIIVSQSCCRDNLPDGQGCSVVPSCNAWCMCAPAPVLGCPEGCLHCGCITTCLTPEAHNIRWRLAWVRVAASRALLSLDTSRGGPWGEILAGRTLTGLPPGSAGAFALTLQVPC